MHKEAIKIREETLGPENHQLAVSWENLGTTQKIAGLFVEAEQSYKRAMAINMQVHGELHPSIAALYEVIRMKYNESKKRQKKRKSWGKKQKTKKQKMNTTTN